MVAITIPLFILPLFIATTHVITQIQNRIAQQKIDTISRLDRQLDFYGGIWTRLYTSNQIFVDFATMEGFSYPEELTSFKDAIDASPQSSISKRYRMVMKDVLGPLQLETTDMIINNFATLREDSMLPMLLLEYLAMVNSYKIIFNRWDAGDFSMHFSCRRFPPDLLTSLDKEFRELKAEKSRLLNGKSPSLKLIAYKPAFNPYYKTLASSG